MREPYVHLDPNIVITPSSGVPTEPALPPAAPPDSSSQPIDTEAARAPETIALADFDGPCPHVLALRQIREEWQQTINERDTALSALAEAQRERDELERVGWSSVAALHAAYMEMMGRWTVANGHAERAEAAIQRARSVERKLWEQVAQLKALHIGDGLGGFDRGRLTALQDAHGDLLAALDVQLPAEERSDEKLLDETDCHSTDPNPFVVGLPVTPAPERDREPTAGERFAERLHDELEARWPAGGEER